MTTLTRTRSRDRLPSQAYSGPGRHPVSSAITRGVAVAPKQGDGLDGALTPLGKLIADVMAENGWSYSDAGKACGLPRSTVHGLVHSGAGRRMLNRPATLEGLARGLGLPLRQVRAAAAASSGIEVEYADELTATPDDARLWKRLRELKPSERRKVAAMIDALFPPATPPRPAPRQRKPKA